MKSVRQLLASLFAISVIAIDARAQEPERLSYGSRAGMEVMVLGKSGIGTSKAVIKIKLTRDNAAEFCEIYLEDLSAKCIRKVLKEDGSRLRPTVSGNCETRTWTDMYGRNYVLKGRSKISSDDFTAEYIIQDRKTQEVLDSSMASGYAVALGVFEALCPNFSATLSKRSESEGDNTKGDTPNRSVARGLTDAEKAQGEQLAAKLPSPDELELVSGLSMLSNWTECLANFEENLGYDEDGLTQTVLMVDEKQQIGYQALSNENGDNLVEARCIGGRYTFSAVMIVPYKK
jgi:hypothetical protein